MQRIKIYSFFIQIFICFCCTALKAQKVQVGIQVGITYNSVNTNLIDRSFERNGGLPGYSIQIPCQINFSKKIILETGLGLIHKNNKVYRVGQYSGAYENSVNQYLQAPVAIKLCMWQGKKIKFVAGSGFYSAFLFSSTRKGKIFNLYNSTINLNNGQSELLISLSPYMENRNLKEEGYKRLEIGGLLSTSIQYFLSPHSSLVWDINFMRSFNGKPSPHLVTKKDQNNTFLFSMGIFKSL